MALTASLPGTGPHVLTCTLIAPAIHPGKFSGWSGHLENVNEACSAVWTAGRDLQALSSSLLSPDSNYSEAYHASSSPKANSNFRLNMERPHCGCSVRSVRINNSTSLRDHHFQYFRICGHYHIYGFVALFVKIYTPEWPLSFHPPLFNVRAVQIR